MQIRKIVEYLNNRFPADLASSFDKSIGFAIGDQETEVTKVLLSLDLTYEVCLEAIEKGCNFIVTHHPFLFNPINTIHFNSPQGKIIKFMCEHNLSTFSMHTNLDSGIGGVNDCLAEMLGIEFSHEEAFKDDMLRYGKIKETKLRDLASIVKTKFNLSGVRVLGDLDSKVNTLGILGGSGANNYLLDDAKNKNCDCYITGEVHLNNAIYAKQIGLSLIEVNHGVEKFVFNNLQKELNEEFGDIFVISNINTDPLISL